MGFEYCTFSHNQKFVNDSHKPSKKVFELNISKFHAVQNCVEEL